MSTKRQTNDQIFKLQFIDFVLPIIKQQLNMQDAPPQQVMSEFLRSQSKCKLDWPMLDEVFNKRPYSNGRSFAEKYFYDVIKPHFLQQYPPELVSKYYSELTSLITNNTLLIGRQKSAQQYKELKTKLLEQFYAANDLKNESVFAFKPLQDKLRRKFDLVVGQKNLSPFIEGWVEQPQVANMIVFQKLMQQQMQVREKRYGQSMNSQMPQNLCNVQMQRQQQTQKQLQIPNISQTASQTANQQQQKLLPNFFTDNVE